MIWTDERGDWFYTSDGHLYFVPRRVVDSGQWSEDQRRLARFVTFTLGCFVFSLALFDVTVIVYFMAGGM